MCQGERSRFRVLVCIDGSEESYRGLRYAARLERGIGADIEFLHVRLLDKDLRAGGLQVRVARQNILDWGLDLPGVRHLEKARKMLIELGEIAEEWEVERTRREVSGDPVGEHYREYLNDKGNRIGLKLKTGSHVGAAIVEECEQRGCNLVIVGASGRRRHRIVNLLGTGPVAQHVAVHAPCSVIVARNLEESHGHLIYTDGSEASVETVRKDSVLAGQCSCPISLLSVALSEEERSQAEDNVAGARDLLQSLGIAVAESVVRVGDPVREIVEEGKPYSLIVLADPPQTGLRRYFMSSLAFSVMEHARNSVLLMR